MPEPNLHYDFLPTSQLRGAPQGHHAIQAKKWATLLRPWIQADSAIKRGFVAHILGDRGNGKSTFLSALQEHLKDGATSKVRTIWFDLETFRSAASLRPVPFLLSRVATRLSEAPENERAWTDSKVGEKLKEQAWSNIDEETAAQVALAFSTSTEEFRKEFGQLRDSAYSLAAFCKTLNEFVLINGRFLLIVLDDIDLLDDRQAIDLLVASAYLAENTPTIRFASLSEAGQKRLNAATYRRWSGIDWSATNIGSAWARVASAQAAVAELKNRKGDDFSIPAQTSADYAQGALQDARQRNEARQFVRRLLGASRSSSGMNSVRKLMFLRWPDEKRPQQVLPASWVFSEALWPVDYASDDPLCQLKLYDGQDWEIRRNRHLAMIAAIAEAQLEREDEVPIVPAMLLQLLEPELNEVKDHTAEKHVAAKLAELKAQPPGVKLDDLENLANVFIDNFPSNWRGASLFTNFVIQQRHQIVGLHQPFDQLTPWRLWSSRKFRMLGLLLREVAPECQLAIDYWEHMERLLLDPVAGKGERLKKYVADIDKHFEPGRTRERVKGLVRALFDAAVQHAADTQTGRPPSEAQGGARAQDKPKQRRAKPARVSEPKRKVR